MNSFLFKNPVFVGDAVWDVQSAARAGVPCVGLLTGGTSAAELTGAGAVAVYDDVCDALAPTWGRSFGARLRLAASALAVLPLTVVAAVARLWDLARPHTLVFDETYYVKQAYTLLMVGYAENTSGSSWPLVGLLIGVVIAVAITIDRSKIPIVK